MIICIIATAFWLSYIMTLHYEVPVDVLHCLQFVCVCVHTSGDVCLFLYELVYIKQSASSRLHAGIMLFCCRVYLYITDPMVIYH